MQSSVLVFGSQAVYYQRGGIDMIMLVLNSTAGHCARLLKYQIRMFSYVY
jgi:hypothetical protein